MADGYMVMLAPFDGVSDLGAIDLGAMMEITDLAIGTQRFFDGVEQAAHRWDGKQAIA